MEEKVNNIYTDSKILLKNVNIDLNICKDKNKDVKKNIEILNRNLNNLRISYNNLNNICDNNNDETNKINWKGIPNNLKRFLLPYLKNMSLKEKQIKVNKFAELYAKYYKNK